MVGGGGARVGLVGLIAAVLVAGAGCVSAFGGSPDEAGMERIKQSPQFNGTIFINPQHTATNIDVIDSIDRRLNGEQATRPPSPLVVQARARGDWGEEAPGGVRATWLGHATVLVELEGVRVLTDPIWSERASPLTSVGPSRFQPVPVALAELPPLDAVIISHDHYDHLDEATIRALAPTGVRFYVPLGVGAHLLAWGVGRDQIEELDWWDSRPVGDSEVTLVATPARHFSGRTLWDRDATLWASWSIVGERGRVYFGGDTGMFDGFAEIGSRLGPFDLTLMPIGAYDRNWRAIHVTPEEAVVAHQAVQGRVLIPIHWGTFDLAFHAWDEPVERLLSFAESEQVQVVVPELGEIVALSHEQAPRRWWRELPGEGASEASAEGIRMCRSGEL